MEFQEAAARNQNKQTANQAQEGYWKASPVDQKRCKEASHRQIEKKTKPTHRQHIHKHMFFHSFTSLVGVFFFFKWFFNVGSEFDTKKRHVLNFFTSFLDSEIFVCWLTQIHNEPGKSVSGRSTWPSDGASCKPWCFGRLGSITSEERGRLVRCLGWWPNSTSPTLEARPAKVKCITGCTLHSFGSFGSLW